MIKQYNCPNCAAPITGDSCPYCGTVIHDFTAIHVGEPSFIKIKDEDKIIIMRIMVDEVSITNESSEHRCHGCNFSYVFTRTNNVRLNLSGHAISGDSTDGSLFTVIMQDDYNDT